MTDPKPKFKTTLNVAMLRKVKRHILKNPARLRMDSWVKRGQPDEKIINTSCGYNEPSTYNIPSCGTVGCIAGWVTLLDAIAKKEEYQDNAISERARAILNENYRFNPFELFYVDYWPEEFAAKYTDEDVTQEERAKIVGEVIDLYIKQYQEREKEYFKIYGNLSEAC